MNSETHDTRDALESLIAVVIAVLIAGGLIVFNVDLIGSTLPLLSDFLAVSSQAGQLNFIIALGALVVIVGASVCLIGVTVNFAAKIVTLVIKEVRQ